MMGYADFRQLVRETLDLQAAYFKQRTPDLLAQCKAKERQLRDELDGRPAQPGLFDRPAADVDVGG